MRHSRCQDDEKPEIKRFTYGLIITGTGAYGVELAVLPAYVRHIGKIRMEAHTVHARRRDNEITESLEQAKQARAELTGVKVESQNILKEARRERDAIIKNAKEERERMIEAARADASREAAAIIKDANSQIEREKQQAKEDLKKDIAGISVAIASKVLGDELKDSARQQKTLEDSIKDMNL